MPIVHIHLRDIWSPEQARGISDAIHLALVDAFRIPDHDYHHLVHRCDPGEFILSDSKSVNTVLIEMSIFAGRSPEAKAKLYRGISDRLAVFGIAPESVLVVLQEQPMENWGLRGVRGDQVELGFERKV